MIVDINDPSCHGKPLWLVYGHAAWPSLLCCKLESKLHGYTVIWGFSIYRNSPGFRTIGTDVNTWIESHKSARGYTMWEFYDDQDEALARLKTLTDCSKVKVKR